MKKVIVMLAPGFEEIETIAVVDLLRRAGAKVTLAATSTGPIEGSRGVKVVPDCQFDTVSDSAFDLIVLPGGQPGTSNLQECSKLLVLLKKMHSERRLIGAICAAPLVLQSADILKGKNITSHPSIQGKLNNVQYRHERVVVDGNIITSQAPGTAMEFSLKLVEILFNKERVDAVNSGVMAQH
ncbi:MAG: 4-methyl-5(B-hydroxyethyl)-thiazole monophosphate biosynthesis protein [Nitrospinae bacterium RIFCSPLOWO2_12_FULL_47_7]|nr:MAG: 4-methyl-5(B-hydroxyethyl)-thiazole monophosphate biosynthesis protein [Nitrospinae bacterium RIFCSPLOWO2_12_FULL_47_7]